MLNYKEKLFETPKQFFVKIILNTKTVLRTLLPHFAHTVSVLPK